MKKSIYDKYIIGISYGFHDSAVALIQNGIVLNAAAYTHTSVGIADAVRSVKASTIEVHISNTISREDYRHISYIAPHAKGIIMGFGLYSYDLAISSFTKKL